MLIMSGAARAQNLFIKEGWVINIKESIAIENPRITIVAGKIFE